MVIMKNILALIGLVTLGFLIYTGFLQLFIFCLFGGHLG